MAMYEGIEQQLKDAKAEYGKAVEELKKFKEGENDGKWLEELRGKVRSNSLNEEEKEEKKRLEEEEKRLKKNVDDRLKQVEELVKALVKFGGGEGNEQIA